MANKLKRKLPEDFNAANANESFVSYGTPLPAVTSTKRDKGEFVPVWQQEVRDEKGRRRLHGAFTGGFSAGYFNSVGSKEGWTPSTFKSSRSDRQQAQQTAEDFMDEEDLAELKGSRVLQTNEQFDLLGGTQAELARKGEQSDAFRDMIAPSNDRIGEKLLKKMGWREGQGVGPRISAKARRRQAIELGLERQLGDENEENEGESSKHLFAPLDRPLIVIEAKEDQRGLGSASVQTLGKQSNEQSTRKAPVGGAFGIGALEEADEDDYADESGQHGYRPLHSMTIDDDDAVVNTADDWSSRSRGDKRPTATSSETFNDGTPVIPSFKLAGRAQQPDKWFEPPNVPAGFKPDPQRIWSKHTAKPPQPVQKGLNMLNADARAEILGEEKIKAPPQSVFDFLSAKDKARLASIKDGIASKSAQDEAAPPQLGPVAADLPSLDPTTAQAALKGFLPFGENPAKQERYKRFLEAQSQSRQPRFDDDLSTEERRNELNGFVQAARIFKPMAGAMASRFTSGGASHVQQPDAPPAGLRQYVAPVEPVEPEVVEPLPSAPLTTAQQAARDGKFGYLTRTVTKFRPNRLLCKRFNVPNPYPDDEDEETVTQDLLNPAAMNDLLRTAGYHRPPQRQATPPPTTTDDPVASTSASKTTNGERAPRPLGQVGLGEDETQGRDTLTYERPDMALFKAIFADSSDEEDEPEARTTTESKEIVEEQAKTTEPVPAWLSVPSSTSATAGAQEAQTAQKVAEAVSLQDFKPQFVSKANRTTDSLSSKPKKSKKKAKGTGLSFDVEDGGGEETAVKKKDKSKRRPAQDEAAVEWVEKAAPAAAAAATVPAPSPTPKLSIPKSRPRASDLM